MALKVAGYFERYAPRSSFVRLRDPPGLHYHAVAYWGGGCATDPIERFDTTRGGRGPFADDPEAVRWRRSDGGLRVMDSTTNTLPLCRGKGASAAMTANHDTRPRPRSLPSTTTKLQTEFGNLYVTVSTDEDGEPFEVFGWLGKGGSFQHGVTELACRLISLHLRRGNAGRGDHRPDTGHQEMQPFWNNVLPDGRSVPVLGLGDGIAHILKAHLKAKEERESWRRKRW